jgi:D-beta-D-heptose 7-phosphate kinase/D-beta-D-heptose 1-phosphate adenosyltransferase
MEENGKRYKMVEPNTIQQRAMRITKGTASFCDRFVPDHGELVKLIEVLRAMGCTIVFTTGAWDLIHGGHCKYIAKGKEEAAKLYPEADQLIMIVGVDTDELTKQRKGPDRPIVPQDERVDMLHYLRPVDIITLQYEMDQLYGLICPDVQIVSTSTKDLADLEKVECHCGHLINLPPQAETSTTARVRRLSLDGAVSVFLKIQGRLTQTLKEVSDEIEKR